MTVVTADFETGTNGNTIATGDTGSATAWNAVTIGANVTITYDNTHPAHGSLAAKFAASTSAGASFLAWTGLTVPTDNYGRFYVYPTTLAGSGGFTRLCTLLNGASVSSQMGVTSAASPKLVVDDSTTTQKGVGTTTILVNTLYRVEYHSFQDATVGQVTLRLYSGDSTSITETVTSSTFNNLASATAVRWGYATAPGVAATHILDGLVANATNWPGPFPVNSVAPVVSGSTPVGSVLSTTDGTWGGTFTMTYQWTRAGVNIGGATSSTYTTVSADAGSAIGCKVTATGQQATNENATTASSNTITAVSAAGLQGFRFGGFR